MRRDVRVYLLDVLEACEKLEEFTAGKTLDEYLAGNMLRSAVERQLGIIGEAMRQALSHMPAIANSISEHERIIAFRNRLVHGYMEIDHEVVWRVLERDLPLLRAQTQVLLRELDAQAGEE